MPKDDRTYIRVHDGMPDHPKIAGLSDKAFRLLIELWAYSSRHLTDGRIPSVIAKKRGAKARDELSATGLLSEHETGHECHDYLEHQRSKEHIEAIKEKRREAGRKGGRPKANQNQIGKQTESKGQSQNNPETEEVLRTSQTETKEPPVVPLDADASAEPEPRRNGRKRPKRPLPDDWTPKDDHLAICRERGLNPAGEVANFRDHAQANDRRQVDWDASFRTWLRNARASPTPIRSKPPTPKPAPRPAPEGPFQFRPPRPGEDNRLR